MRHVHPGETWVSGHARGGDAKSTLSFGWVHLAGPGDAIGGELSIDQRNSECVCGCRTPPKRSVILGYLEDGPNLVTMAMNGWGEGEPAWWLNLQAHPQARVQLTNGTRQVVAHAATGQEREQLWDRWRSLDKNLDDYARRRSQQTAVVVLEPRTEPV